MSVEKRLARLLFIVPYVAQRDGVLLEDLAALLEISPRKLVEDIELLSMVGRPPLTPDHLIDIHIEDDLVCVELDQRLSRPPRLSVDEAAAVLLATQLVVRNNAHLASIVTALRTALGAPMAEHVERLAASLSVDLDVQSDELLNVLRMAVEQRSVLQISYYSASSDRARRYVLWPLAIAAHSGFDYLVALDASEQKDHLDAAALHTLPEKLFRVDRMNDVELLKNKKFPAGRDADLERFARAQLFEGTAATATLRFSAQVAARVLEQFAPEQVQEQDDGGVIVQLTTSSPAWLARWVLPFAEEAEVLAPPDKRAEMAALVAEAAEVYNR